jgi:hypothetical protein
MSTNWKFVAALLLVGSCGFAGTLFQDTFENGQVENSDTVNGFWMFTEVDGSGAAVTEAGGKLSLTGPKAGNNAHSMLQSKVLPAVNFSVSDGITIAADMSVTGDTETPQNDAAVFFLSSSPGTIYKGGAENIFAVEFRRDTDVRVRTRTGSGSAMVNLRAIGIEDACGFKLVMNDSTYTLTVNKTKGKPQVLSGTHNLKASDWEKGCAIGVMTVKGGKESGRSSSMSIDNLVITSK